MLMKGKMCTPEKQFGLNLSRPDVLNREIVYICVIFDIFDIFVKKGNLRTGHY